MQSCAAPPAWACSVSEIDWQARGYEGTKLGYLIGQTGYFHDGHRAVDDCHALLEVLDRPMDGQSAFAELYERCQRSRVCIFAENARPSISHASSGFFLLLPMRGPPVGPTTTSGRRGPLR